MKFHILFLVLTLLINQSLSMKLEKSAVEIKTSELRSKRGEEVNKADAAKTASFNSELLGYWKVLFTDTERKSCTMAKMKAKIDSGISGIVSSQPIPRYNYWAAIDMGFGKSALLFDYLDPLLLEEVIKEFKKITDAVKACPAKKKGENDPYNLYSMLSIPKTPEQDEADLIRLMKKAKANFDETVWRKSYNTIQLNKIIKDNHWDFVIGDQNPGKSLVDRYDFNGDGRLSDDEFIVACIQTNKNIYGKQKCDNCLEDFVFNFIQPIYLWSNLDNDASLTADEMWKSFKYLKRSEEGKTADCDMYKCITAGVEMNTTAVNDFILKARRSFNGSVTKSEFINGMLLGFWYRQVDESQIYSDDKRSNVSQRWKDKTQENSSCAPST